MKTELIENGTDLALRAHQFFWSMTVVALVFALAFLLYMDLGDNE